MEIVRKTKKVGQDDPRRIVHSLKVGLALTLISLIYYFKPLYDVFGDNAIWAVITVVVVLELSVGKPTTQYSSVPICHCHLFHIFFLNSCRCNTW